MITLTTPEVIMAVGMILMGVRLALEVYDNSKKRYLRNMGLGLLILTTAFVLVSMS